MNASYADGEIKIFIGKLGENRRLLEKFIYIPYINFYSKDKKM